LAAVSVGVIDGDVRLDLDYQADARAQVDMNVAYTAGGKFVEIQGSAENGEGFDRSKLNALLDLKTVFFLSTPFAPAVPTDAANMAAATGIPAVLWTIIWIAIAFGILMLALRFYVAARDRAFDAKKDLVFERKVEV